MPVKLSACPSCSFTNPLSRMCFYLLFQLITISVTSLFNSLSSVKLVLKQKKNTDSFHPKPMHANISDTYYFVMQLINSY